MKKRIISILKGFCPHAWTYSGHENRRCKWCGRKEVAGVHMEIIPAGLGVITVNTTRWVKE